MREAEVVRELVQGDELSLYDLVQPLLDGWRLVAAAILLGLLSGAAVWLVRGYGAELVARPIAQLSFVEWRIITARLPDLAELRFENGLQSGADDKTYRVLKVRDWWTKNVTPKYRYSKQDLKDLGAISTAEQENGAVQIDAIVFKGRAMEREAAQAQATEAEQFVREGGLFLALKTIIERRDLASRQVSSDSQAELSRNEVELAYLEKRREMVKKLAQKFPGKQSSGMQAFFELKGESARFLPLDTQQIALESEIGQVEEAISRAKDRLSKNFITRAFVGRALPLLQSSQDGFDLARQLGAIESEVRTGIDPGSRVQLAEIDEIANELKSVEERFKSLFETSVSVSAQRPSLGLPLALGLLGGGLGGVLFVFVNTAWRRAKANRLLPTQAGIE